MNNLAQMSMSALQAPHFVLMEHLVKTHLVHISVPVQQDILVSIVKQTSTIVITTHAFTTVHVLMASICTHVTVHLDTLV